MSILDSLHTFDKLTQQLNSNIERLGRVDSAVKEFKENEKQALEEIEKAKNELTKIKGNFENESASIQAQILDLEKKFDNILLTFFATRPELMNSLWDLAKNLAKGKKELANAPIFKECVALYTAWEEISKKVQKDLPEEVKKAIEPKSKWILGTIWRIITEPVEYIKETSIGEIASDLIIIIWPGKILWLLKALPRW